MVGLGQIGLAALGLVIIYLLFGRMVKDISGVLWNIDPLVELYRKLNSKWEREYQRFKDSTEYRLVLNYCRNHQENWDDHTKLTYLVGLIRKKGYDIREGDVRYLVKKEMKLGRFRDMVGETDVSDGKKKEVDLFKIDR